MKKRHIKKIILSLTVVSTLLISYGCASKEIEEVGNLDESNTYIENTIPESLEEVGSTEQSTEPNINGGEGSSAVVLEEQPTTESESTNSAIKQDVVVPDYSAEFYSQDDTGKYIFTEKFYTMVLNHPYFAGATVEEVSDYYNENDFYLVDLQFGELNAFNNCLNNAYDREGQPYLDEVVQSTPSTNTETQSQAQTGQNTTPSQSQSTTNSSENTTEEEPEYLDCSDDPDPGDGGNLVGNTILQSAPSNQNETTTEENYDPWANASGAYTPHIVTPEEAGDGGNLVGNTILQSTTSNQEGNTNPNETTTENYDPFEHVPGAVTREPMTDAGDGGNLVGDTILR